MMCALALMMSGAGAPSKIGIRPGFLQKSLGKVSPKKIDKKRLGIEPCVDPLPLVERLPISIGETVRYVVDVDGLSVGVVDFRTTQRGHDAGQVVTEYRSQFKLDSLVASLLPVDGRAASLVQDARGQPLRAMNQYTVADRHYEETVVWDTNSGKLTSERKRGEKSKTVTRTFDVMTRDFVSGFYFLRALPRESSGCTVIYGSQRAYIVHLKYAGEERVSTPVGSRPADRYEIRYAHERSKKIANATVWLSLGPDRLPYRAEIIAQNTLDARIHLYEPGKPLP